MLSVAAALRARLPELEIAVVQGRRRAPRAHRGARRRRARVGWARVETGDLHRSLARARAAFSVSGTVLLDLLHHRLPTVCIYRVARTRDVRVHRHGLITPFFASPNLLAGRESCPSSASAAAGPFDEVVTRSSAASSTRSSAAPRWWASSSAAERLGPPGACHRAALARAGSRGRAELHEPRPRSAALNSGPDAAYAADSMQAETTRLMTLAKHGDREAFDELTGRVRTMAFRVAQSLVGSRDDALELSQEALLKTYRARETYRDGDPFLPWFQRIVRNTCYSWMRRNGKVKASSLSPHHGDATAEDDGDWQVADPDQRTPLEPLIADERARVFWSAFQKLGARDREILALRHFQELSYLQIADILSIPVGTVMSRLFHARRRLREGLGNALDEDIGPRSPRSARMTTAEREPTREELLAMAYADGELAARSVPSSSASSRSEPTCAARSRACSACTCSRALRRDRSRWTTSGARCAAIPCTSPGSDWALLAVRLRRFGAARLRAVGAVAGRCAADVESRHHRDPRRRRTLARDLRARQSPHPGLRPVPGDPAMIVVTTDAVPGRQIVETIGMVRGNTVRAAHVARDLSAWFKNVVGGEVEEYTKLLAESREQALDRMVAEARARGATAIVGLRFMTCEISSGMRRAARVRHGGQARRGTALAPRVERTHEVTAEPRRARDV
jgi:RNA polymerase sigma factor (sigma-70 family)